VVTEVGDDMEVYGRPHPTVWKDVCSNVETMFALESEVKRVQTDEGDAEMIYGQMEGKLEQELNDV
jgi:hypothetical protein